MASVYIETSIVSYAAARPHPDPAVAARQRQARDWWTFRSSGFDLFTSQLVLDEASRGDVSAAAERLRLLEHVPLVPINDEAKLTAAELVARSLLPQVALIDALHIAAAAHAGIEYLLTLNCRHIANAFALPHIYRALEDLGVTRPLICTPAEFLGDADEHSAPGY